MLVGPDRDASLLRPTWGPQSNAVRQRLDPVFMTSEPNATPPALPPLDPPRSTTHITVSLSIRTLGMIAAALVTYFIFRSLSGILMIFPIAILIATAVDKPAKWLERHHVARPFAVLIIFGLLVGAAALTVSMLVPLVTQEVRSLRTGLPEYRADIEQVLNRFHLGEEDSNFSLASITTSIAEHLETLATHLTSITLDAGRLALALFVTFVISVMMALDPSLATNFTRRFLSPERSARLIQLTASIDHRIGYWVRGQILIALTFGLLFGLGIGAIGIPFALTLGVTAALLEIVPYLGGAVTVVLATLMGLTIGVPHAIAVIVLYVVLVNVESHVLAPLLMGKAVGLPSVVVLGALFVGLEAKGLPGVILAVPTVLVITAIIDQFWPSAPKPTPTSRLSSLQHRITGVFHRKSEVS